MTYQLTAAIFNSLAELKISAHKGEFRRACVWLEKACIERGVPAHEIWRLDVCLNEVLANILNHGGDGVAVDEVGLCLEVYRDHSDNRAILHVSDAGLAFDPLSVAAPPRPPTLAEAQPGGLGLVMVRDLADNLNYSRSDGRNSLSISVSWVEAGVRAFEGRRYRRKHGGPSIQWVPLFRGTDEKELDRVLTHCQVLRLPAGTILLRSGETNHNVYIPLAGEMVAYLDDDLNPDAAISIPPGECIGELSAIDGKQLSAMVMARSDARVLKLSRDEFWQLLTEVPGAARNLIVTLTERMRQTNELALRAQREHLELAHLKKELDIARQLQASMLPLHQPLFPERTEIEICGFMEPTSQVGGDLFDAFFVDDEHLFFCIGDVSGHGIAAALFMARTIGLLRILAVNTWQPGKLLEDLNNRLVLGNDANIFVTLYCGFLNVATGALTYASGGHCAPIVSSGTQTDFLPIPRGSLIGAKAGLRYRSMKHRLAPGEILFCYTDGVTEAQNSAGEGFSDELCLQVLRQAGAPPLPKLLETMRREIASFTGSVQLEDDCTMLALRIGASGPASGLEHRRL